MDMMQQERAALAVAIADDLEFIAIVESSAGAIADPTMRKRLLLLGGVTGATDEEKLRNAREQMERKSKPWELPCKLFRLVPVSLK